MNHRWFIETLRRHRVKLRHNKASSPHLNGKVERSQQTDLVEFYALEIEGKGKARVAREREELEQRLKAWQRFYNELRSHGGIGSETRQRRWEEVEPLTPTRVVLDEALRWLEGAEVDQAGQAGLASRRSRRATSK